MIVIVGKSLLSKECVTTVVCSVTTTGATRPDSVHVPLDSM